MVRASYTADAEKGLRLSEICNKRYFSDFYAYLCNYAHCNYSILDCYLDENNMFTLSGKKDEYLIRILVLFVYTKTFESIVTVEGEDFLDKREGSDYRQHSK